MGAGLRGAGPARRGPQRPARAPSGVGAAEGRGFRKGQPRQALWGLGSVGGCPRAWRLLRGLQGPFESRGTRERRVGGADCLDDGSRSGGWPGVGEESWESLGEGGRPGAGGRAAAEDVRAEAVKCHSGRRESRCSEWKATVLAAEEIVCVGSTPLPGTSLPSTARRFKKLEDYASNPRLQRTEELPGSPSFHRSADLVSPMCS
ncbi:PREDICTED: uncharacterized protein LOC106148132 [Chinchilla lanigera]|uniref:uncharacterized protein LOC106148132 n=1 Tax=Chinchilla lanigera TaxID=34839 RepID=UPI000696F64F|nr:PREDICTED: uncharacterized protein LOC106148132 [Chinchilla lanigera]